MNHLQIVIGLAILLGCVLYIIYDESNQYYKTKKEIDTKEANKKEVKFYIYKIR
jgi:ubiquinone biosynthesis protein COQ9